MKKLLLASGIFVLQLCAYNLEVSNKTDGELIVQVNFSTGPGVCAPMAYVIKSKKSHNFATKGCCPTDLIIWASSGRAKAIGQYEYTHERSNNNKGGYRHKLPGLNCRNMKVIINNTEDGNIIAETK